MVPDHRLEATDREQNSDNMMLCHARIFINCYRGTEEAHIFNTV